MVGLVNFYTGGRKGQEETGRERHGAEGVTFTVSDRRQLNEWGRADSGRPGVVCGQSGQAAVENDALAEGRGKQKERKEG